MPREKTTKHSAHSHLDEVRRMSALAKFDQSDSSIESFLHSLGSSVPSIDSVFVSLSQEYTLVEGDRITGDLRSAWEPLFRDPSIEAVLLPKDGNAAGIVPLGGERKKAFHRIQEGCLWSEAVASLSLGAIEKLATNGILKVQISDTELTGAAVVVLTRFLTGELGRVVLASDPLSSACIVHASRFLSLDRLSVANRLYRYNHYSSFGSDACEAISKRVAKLLSSGGGPVFSEVAVTEVKLGWRFFENKLMKPKRRGQFDYKLYLSPVPDDTEACVENLLNALSETAASAWKIGRGSHGISRPDKICIYFAEQHEADAAAELLGATLKNIRSQGIPFTRRYDLTGLVSGGIDPPMSDLRDNPGRGTSWRVWISAKIALALTLASMHKTYPISAEQNALWTLKVLGIDPERWCVTDENFWRN